MFQYVSSLLSYGGLQDWTFKCSVGTPEFYPLPDDGIDLFDENGNGEGRGRKRACRVYLQSVGWYRFRSRHRWTVSDTGDGLLLFYGDLLLLMVHTKYHRTEMLHPNTPPGSEDLIAVLSSDTNANTPTTAKT